MVLFFKHFNGETSAGFDYIGDCFFWLFLLPTLKRLFTDVILYSFLTASASSCLFLHFVIGRL